MTRRNRTLFAGVSAVALLLTSCAASGDGSEGGESNSVTIMVEPSAQAAFVAEQEGFFGDLEVDVTTVGYDEAESMLVAGNTQIAWMGPLDAAEFVSQGEDFKYLSTAGGLNMYNGVLVRAEDSDEYQDITDLRGKKLGIPGFGTGTWATFSVFVNAYYGFDAPEDDFDIVTADSGALLALLEKGEIDGALLFAAEAASGRFNDEFEAIFSMTEAMQEQFGVPLTVNGMVGTSDWIDSNPETVKTVIAGLDEAVNWMAENSEEFLPGGKYEDLADGDGWLASQELNEGIVDLLSEKKWFLTSEDYTGEWVESVYQLIQDGEGTLVDEVPSIEDIFVPAN